jgi:hypothetical protein
MELGAAWALKKRAILLIGPGANYGDIPGPFKGVIHAIKLADREEMSGLTATVARHAGLPVSSTPKMLSKLDVLIGLLAT